jgi:hypothetical protein
MYIYIRFESLKITMYLACGLHVVTTNQITFDFGSYQRRAMSPFLTTVPLS